MDEPEFTPPPPSYSTTSVCGVCGVLVGDEGLHTKAHVIGTLPTSAQLSVPSPPGPNFPVLFKTDMPKPVMD